MCVISILQLLLTVCYWEKVLVDLGLALPTVTEQMCVLMRINTDSLALTPSFSSSTTAFVQKVQPWDEAELSVRPRRALPDSASSREGLLSGEAPALHLPRDTPTRPYLNRGVCSSSGRSRTLTASTLCVLFSCINSLMLSLMQMKDLSVEMKSSLNS